MGVEIFPSGEEIEKMPASERMVYNALAGLSKNYTIFHSVRYYEMGIHKTYWRENDFIIISKEMGMLILEVKGGAISYKNGIFYQTSKYGDVSELSEKRHNDPLTQALDGKFHYIEAISEKLGNDFIKRFSVEPCVCFPACQIGRKIEQFPLNYREIKEAILDVNSLNNMQKAIDRAYKQYNADKFTKISDYEYKEAVSVIAQNFDLIEAPSINKGELENKFIKLTNEQIGLLDYISEQDNATIQGVAGTGKTIIAKEAARRLGAEGRKVLFLCFNNLLYQDLKERYKYNNVTYYNIHSLINKYNPGHNISSIEDRAKALTEIKEEKLDFDDVIIDEAQDFDNAEIMYFKDLMTIKEGHFLVFYDKNQLLTTSEVPEWITNSECKLVLTKNCRNTREIALTSYNVIDVELKQKVKMVNGEVTQTVFSNEKYVDDLAGLIRHYLDLGYTKQEITVLSLNGEGNSIYSSFNKVGNVKLTRERGTSGVFFTTASKFKGLESRVIIVVDIDELCFSDEKKKRLFYVACSRATQHLGLMVVGDNKKIQSIASAIDKSKKNAKGKIIMKTQSKELSFEEDW